LMTFASKEIVDALEHLFQLPVIAWDAAKEKEEEVEKKDLYFEVLDANAACEARARITLSIPLLERVLAVAKEEPMIRESSLSGELLQGEILIGRAILSSEDWKNLVPGDLIILQEPSALATGQGRCLIKKSGAVPMVLQADDFKPLILPLEKIFPVGMKPSPPVSEEQGEQQKENSSYPSIPLELNFSAGLLSLTIEEALQLIKTKSIEKPLQVSRPLKIFIQERVVGAGELVEINGRYALVVTQL
jgi:flagellar motor switch/type III secretory pathway protein FliN